MTEQDHTTAIFNASRVLNEAIKAACEDGVLVSIDWDNHRVHKPNGRRFETQLVRAGVYPAS